MEPQMERDYIKGGEFLISDQTPAEVFTPEDFTDEQRMIGDTTREFVDNEVAAESRSDGEARLGGRSRTRQKGRRTRSARLDNS